MKLAYFLSPESVVVMTLVANFVGGVATLDRVSRVVGVLGWMVLQAFPTSPASPHHSEPGLHLRSASSVMERCFPHWPYLSPIGAVPK